MLSYALLIMMPCPNILEHLPLELIEHIISILDQESLSPSTRRLHEPPSDLLFKDSNVRPLKCLSLACRTIHQLVAPKIFAHLKIAVDASEEFMDLCKLNWFQHMPNSLHSLVLYQEAEQRDSKQSVGGAYHLDILESRRVGVTRLVDARNPRVLTLIVSPDLLGWLVDHPIDMTGPWAFHIPYQLMRLEQGAFAPRSWFPEDQAHNNQTLSTIRPWNHCTYNEGSFVQAYSHYEYFNYDTVSLHQSPKVSELPCHALHFACLASFKLVAVFPFNHMANTCYFLRMLPNLEHLIVQLAPLPEIQPSCATTSSASSPSDFWLEIESAYVVLRNHIVFDPGNLSKFTILDFTWPGYRNIIDTAMSEISWPWKPDGKGNWTRQVLPRTPIAYAVRLKGTVCPNL